MSDKHTAHPTRTTVRTRETGKDDPFVVTPEVAVADVKAPVPPDGRNPGVARPPKRAGAATKKGA